MKENGTRQMHLGVFTMVAGNHFAGWRMPGAFTNSDDFASILSVAKIAEDAKFDFVFFADGPVCSPDGHPSYVFLLEPTTLLGALSVSTSKIGLVATVSSTFTEPYNLARQIGSVDQISNGRIGWNVVTTASEEAAQNFGRELPDHDDRYKIADEYLQVVQGLWDSWDDGARVADKESGRFLDPAKLHVLDHHGKHFDVRGPLGIRRSPQGQPVIVQAGSSASGQEFAAKYAEVMFTVQQDLSESQRFYQGMQEKVVAAGRSPDSIKILPGLFPVVGRTDEEAQEKYEQLRGYIKPGSATSLMSNRYGHDMSKFPMDGPVPDLPLSEKGAQSYTTVLYAKAVREGLKLKDLHDIFALSRGYLMVSGSPKTIADTIEEWVVGRACDGFMAVPASFPGPFKDFTELVVPELQRRGLFRTDYAGSTLRSHFGLPEPGNRFATTPRHAAEVAAS